jgi:hypothetical protein
MSKEVESFSETIEFIQKIVRCHVKIEEDFGKHEMSRPILNRNRLHCLHQEVQKR